MKHLALLLNFILAFFIANSQSDITLNIEHKLGDQVFALNQESNNDLGNAFTINRLDYYISSIILIHDGGSETTVAKYILVKGGNNVNELLGQFSVTELEGVKFSIGVESPVNNEDPTQWTAPHPLAPQSPSMHWGWTAGYRFIALEGKAGSNLNTKFEMHGLGNSNYFEQTIMFATSLSGSAIDINLEADIARALSGIDISRGPIDHGVDATDLSVLQNYRDKVFAEAGSRTSLNEKIAETPVNVYPNPSKGKISVDLEGQGIKSLKVFDMSGRMIHSFYSEVFSPKANISIDQSGLYLIDVETEQGAHATRKVSIH